MAATQNYFEYMFDPVTAEDFLDGVFERRLFVTQRAEPNYFSDLFSAAAFESYLFAGRPWESPDPWSKGGLIVVGGGHKAFTPKVDTAHEVLEFYAQGSTILLPRAQKRSESISLYCASIAATLGCRVEANAYLTPKNSQGFTEHFDSHDVIVAQIEGEKIWEIGVPKFKLPPLEDVPEEELEESKETIYGITEPSSHRLLPGSVLYMPRGVPHSPRTVGGSHSLHVTFGLYPITWYQLLRELIVQASLSDESLRPSIPLRQSGAQCQDRIKHGLEKRLLRLLEAADIGAAIHKLCNYQHLPGLNSAINSLNGLSCLDDSTTLAMRAGLILEYVPVGENVKVTIDGQQEVLPAKVAPYLDFVRSNNEFQVRQLPSHLPGKSKLVFANWLITKGAAILTAV